MTRADAGGRPARAIIHARARLLNAPDAARAAVTRLLVVLSALAFISLGLPDGLLGVAWPSIRVSFARDLDALGALLAAGTVGYIAACFSSGRVLRHANLGAVLAVSCALTAIALLGFAVSPAWPPLIALALVLGAGGGGVDAALNTYAATNHGPRTLNLLHACYGIGATLGPVIMTAVLARQASWQTGYAIVGGAQLLLAAAFVATTRNWPTTSGAAPADRPHVTIGDTLAQPATLIAALTFVVYAGVEVSIGAWTYSLLTLGRGLTASQAGALVSLFWGALTGGRLLAAAAGGLVVPHRVLQGAVMAIVVGTILIWIGPSPGWTLAGVLIVGGACGPIFPTLVATTPQRLGADHTANAVGVQIAASGLGVAFVPGLVGVVADAYGIETMALFFVALALLLLLVYTWLERAAPLSSRAA
jgi:fucose permease